MEVQVTGRERDGFAIVEVAGELDIHSSPVLRKRLANLMDADRIDLAVDLGGVGFLDSMGLGVLVGALKRIRGLGGRLQLVVDQEKILRVFRMTALTHVFTIHDTPEAALIRSSLAPR